MPNLTLGKGRIIQYCSCPELFRKECSVILCNQFSSVTQLRLTFCHLMDFRTPGLPVHHQLPELTQTRVR